MTERTITITLTVDENIALSKALLHYAKYADKQESAIIASMLRNKILPQVTAHARAEERAEGASQN